MIIKTDSTAITEIVEVDGLEYVRITKFYTLGNKVTIRWENKFRNKIKNSEEMEALYKSTLRNIKLQKILKDE